MGANISAKALSWPETIDKETCQALLKEDFDEVIFDRISVNGVVSKKDLLWEMIRTDVFLTHDWGRDFRDNHAFVAKINRGMVLTSIF